MISDVKFYLKVLVRRLPVMIVLFMICAIASMVIAQRLPTMYRTSATLLVESAQISDNLAESTVQVEASEQLEVIQQRLLTRANLLDIARDIDVLPDMREMTPDEIVQAMRQATGVRRTSGRNKATLMTITFEARDPQKVAAVVNRYTTIVETLSSDFRTGAAEGTLDFFEQQVATLSQNLDAQSAKIVAFKTENSDALPENLEYRLNRQSYLQEQLARAGRELEAIEAQRASAKRIFEATGAVTTTGTVLSPAEKELQALEGQLRAMLSTLSEQNPKVRNLRSRIDGLRATVQAGITTASAEGELEAEDASPLEISLAELDSRAATLNREIGTTRTELAELRASIERTPVNRITLDAMERDLSNTQNLYNDAVKRLSQARVGEQIELSSKGERITVLEAANVPTTPSSPNRPRIVIMGIGLGLGLAGAFFMLLELLNQSIRRPADIVKGIDITPLATVPRIETASHKRWRRVMQVVSLGVILAGVPALLWAIDTFYMPLDLLFETLKDKLG
jgi:polysaccharide chain length determinant protein (PEP-CTERM system associated)